MSPTPSTNRPGTPGSHGAANAGWLFAGACLALGIGVGAWLARPPAPPAVEPSPPPSEPPPRPRRARAESNAPSDATGPVPGSVASRSEAAAPDPAALARFAAAFVELVALDGEGRVVRSFGALPVPFAAEPRALLVPVDALNGAAELRGGGLDAAAFAVQELAAFDGGALAVVHARAAAEPVAFAPADSLAAAALFACDRGIEPARFGRAAGPPADGLLPVAVERPPVARFVADGQGRLVGLAEAADAGWRVRLAEPALAALLQARPTALANVGALRFDRDAAALRERAALYAAGQHFEAALQCYVEAIALDPALVDACTAPLIACLELALAEARQADRVAELLPLAERAGRLLPHAARVLHAVGLALLHEGEHEEAIGWLADAAREVPGDPAFEASLRAAYLHAGEAARAQRRPADAIALLEEGLGRFREDVALLQSLGYAYHEFGDRERARIVLEKVASLDDELARRLAPLLAALAPTAAREGDAVVVRFQPGSGVIRTPATFDGRVEAEAIVDTGASLTAISEGLADRLRIDRGRARRRVVVSTANGKVEAPVVVLPAIDLGGARVTDVEAVVLPLGDSGVGEALIGLNFLVHFDVALDARRGTLTLRPR